MKKLRILSMVLLLVSLGLGCDDDSSKSQAGADEQAQSGESEVVEEGAAEQAEAEDPAPQEAAASADEPGDFSYPGFELTDLTDPQRQELGKLALEELCPCPDAVVSLHECMQQEERCEEADEMAATLKSALLEGGRAQEAQQQIAKERRSEQRGHTFELEGVPYKGNPEASVVIVEFADFQCPHCRTAAAALDEVVERFGDDVVVYFKAFPLGSPMSDLAAWAAQAAHRQGRFWPMHDLIFANQNSLTAAKIDNFARQIGLNFERFKRDMDSSAVRAAVMAGRQEGIAAGVQGTPALFINGQRYMGGLAESDIKAIIAGEQ